MIAQDIHMLKRLKRWFTHHQRDLPWRKSPSPYVVWVSEVMLQQTQAGVVIPYFLRWMKRFPTLTSLAEASQEEVLKMWEGLGYYSRAKNLYQGAQMVVSRFGGELPTSYEELSSIKGLGDYTIGAILSFAFHQKAPAVDGNVLRVISRLFALEEDIAQTKTKKLIREKTLSLLEDPEPWIISEALIELGATICKKKPNCSICPLKEACKAWNQGIEQNLPVNSKKNISIALSRTVAVISCGHSLLLKKGKPGAVMADLYEFPYIEGKSLSLLRDHFSFPLPQGKELSLVSHSFTKYQVSLTPIYFEVEKEEPHPDCEWVSLNAITHKPFSSGHRRILKQVLDTYLSTTKALGKKKAQSF